MKGMEEKKTRHTTSDPWFGHDSRMHWAADVAIVQNFESRICGRHFP